MKHIIGFLCLLIAFLSVESASAGVAQIVTDSLVPDTVYVVPTVGSSGTNSVVPINFVNDELLRGIELTLTWDAGLVNLDSVSYQGGRLDYITIKGATVIGDTVILYCFPLSEADIPVGSGLMCRLHFSHAASMGPLTVTIDSTNITDGPSIHANFFSNVEASQFVPQFVKGELSFVGSSCCTGIRGNVNYSTSDEPDISDLTYLVEYFFGGGPAPPCMLEANIDGSIDEQVDISDLTSLVKFYFESGPPPAPCP